MKTINKRDYYCKLVVYELKDSKEQAVKVAKWLEQCAKNIRSKYKEYDPIITTFRLMK